MGIYSKCDRYRYWLEKVIDFPQDRYGALRYVQSLRLTAGGVW